MKLPSHIPARPIALPLIYGGLSWCELAGWHQYFRKNGDLEKCREIEIAVNELPENEQHWIKKLNYYQPITEIK